MSQLEPDFLLSSIDDSQQAQRSLLFTRLDRSEFKSLPPSNQFAWIVQIGSHGQAERVLPENPALVQEAARGADHCAIIYTTTEATTSLDKFFTGGAENRAIRFIFDFNLSVKDPLRFYNFVQSLHQRQALEGNFYELRVRDLLNYLLVNAHQQFKAQTNSYDPDLLLHDGAVQYQVMQLYINCLPVDKLEQAGLKLDFRSVRLTVKDLAERNAQQLKEFERKRQHYEAMPEFVGNQPVEPTLVENPAIGNNIAAGKPQTSATRLALYLIAANGIVIFIVGLNVSGPAQIIALVVGFLVIIMGAALTYFLQRKPANHSIPAAPVYPPNLHPVRVQPPVPGRVTPSAPVAVDRPYLVPNYDPTFPLDQPGQAGNKQPALGHPNPLDPSLPYLVPNYLPTEQPNPVQPDVIGNYLPTEAPAPVQPRLVPPVRPAVRPAVPPAAQGRSFRLRVEEGLTPGGSQVLHLSGPGEVITLGIRERNSPVLYFWNEHRPEKNWNFPGLDAASLEGVSRVHAHFRLVDGAIWLCSGSPDGNQGARNGTFINGEKLENGPDKGRPLKPNDLIGLGPRASGINVAYNRAGGVTISFEPL